MPRLVSLEVDSAEVLLEEYRAVQQESGDGLTRMQSVAQYALATLGVGTGLGLAAAPRSLTAAAVVLMGLIPVLIVFVLFVLVVETQRVVAARRHLRRLERRITAASPQIRLTSYSPGRPSAHFRNSACSARTAPSSLWRSSR